MSTTPKLWEVAARTWKCTHSQHYTKYQPPPLCSGHYFTLEMAHVIGVVSDQPPMSLSGHSLSWPLVRVPKGLTALFTCSHHKLPVAGTNARDEHTAHPVSRRNLLSPAQDVPEVATWTDYRLALLLHSLSCLSLDPETDYPDSDESCFSSCSSHKSYSLP